MWLDITRSFNSSVVSYRAYVSVNPSPNYSMQDQTTLRSTISQSLITMDLNYLLS